MVWRRVFSICHRKIRVRGQVAMSDFKTITIMIDIESLAGLGANVRVELTADDLRMFAESIVERTLVARERLAEQSAPEREETYLGTREVQQMLGVCEGTLITWAKRGYLVPIKVGSKNRYALSDIRRIQNGSRSETVAEFCKRKKEEDVQ